MKITSRTAFFPLVLAVLVTTACEEEEPPLTTMPPAGAKFVDAEITPEAIVNNVLMTKGDEARRAAAASWANQWIASPGWEGSIEKLSEEHGRPVAWIKYSGNAMMGGSFLVGIDVVDAGGRDMGRVRHIEYTGRIEKVEYGIAGPFPEFKIVIRNAKILKADGK